MQTIDESQGEVAVPNPNSATVWHYDSYDVDGNGEIDEFMETMHRTLTTVAIKDDILYTADFSGIVHCLDAKTGKVYWTHDMLGACWGSPLVADGKVFIGDEDGDLYIFAHGKKKEWLNQSPEDENAPTTKQEHAVRHRGGGRSGCDRQMTGGQPAAQAFANQSDDVAQLTFAPAGGRCERAESPGRLALRPSGG
jgi:outer membrane protein assembly factor BamB